MIRRLAKWIAIFVVCTCLVEPFVRAGIGESRYDALKAQIVSAATRARLDFAEALEHERGATSVTPSDGAIAARWSGRLEPMDLKDDPVRRQTVVKAAERLIGAPYVAGGTGPQGVDCSGLVTAAYGEIGVTLPHRSRVLFGMGHTLEIASLRPGDLVFFDNDSGPAGHVGIYVGGGQVIHASSSRRRVVRDPLSAVVAGNGLTGARALLGGPVRSAGERP